MIVYKLRCEDDHQFDVWFRNSTAYEEQSQKGLVECPQCGSVNISKALMAPNISVSSSAKEKEDFRHERSTSLSARGGEVADVVKLFSAIENLKVREGLDADTAKEVSEQSPAQQRQALKALEKVVRENCVDVGEKFPEEARKMHYGETSKKNIYGRASAEEIVDLFQEGIDVMPLPSFPKEDA